MIRHKGHNYRVAVLTSSQRGRTAMAFPLGDTYGVLVYHGSNEPDLEYLRGHFPSYDGSIGGGVYVDFDEDVAVVYGEYVYALKLLLKPEEIFVVEPEPIEELYGNSIIIGEEVYPFWFGINGERYAVVGGYEDDLERDYGLPIDLGDIGEAVEQHGYKAVYVEGIRPMSELLVFDDASLEMVGLVE